MYLIGARLKKGIDNRAQEKKGLQFAQPSTTGVPHLVFELLGVVLDLGSRVVGVRKLSHGESIWN